MKTKKEILKIVEEIASSHKAKAAWGQEYGITWLTIHGKNINPMQYETLTRELSQKTGLDCYFHMAMSHSIEFILDGKMDSVIKNKDTVIPYESHTFNQQGQLFK